MARKRLCNKASKETRDVMKLIRRCLLDGVDPALAECLVPECEYRGQCNELRSCTSDEKVKHVQEVNINGDSVK